LLVVLLAAWFVAYAWQRTGGGNVHDAIRVNAEFQSATGVGVGTDVRIAGIKIGQVSAVRLDPKSFQAEVTLALDPAVKVPADSSAAVSSEGLLGGTYMGLIPGGSATPLKDGDTIVDTQGSVDLMSMVGQFINKSGGSGGASGSASTPAAPSDTPKP
jgi:phospholipid/cholesterol/gamma-HCH transport system substrate-binding protein